MRFLPLALLVLALAACDSAGGSDAPVLGGTYAASVTDEASGTVVDVSLVIPPTESGDFEILGGSIAFTTDGVRDATTLTGTGTFTPPSSVTLTPIPANPRFAFGPLTATLSSDGSRISSTLQGETLTLVRQ